MTCMFSRGLVKPLIGMAALLVVVTFWAACGSGWNPFSRFRVTMVCDVGGLGDQGFNDAGWRGVQAAAEKIGEVEPKIIQSREQADYINNLSKAADSSNAVIALGYLMQDSVATVAKEYPDTPFIFIDGLIDAPNVASFDFKGNEGGFLGGMMAAAATQTNVVAVMPGMDIPPVEALQAGYKAGVLFMANLLKKEITVLSNTIGSFSDPVKAKSIAESLIAQDADVIFQLAGSSGLGVLEAVKEAPGRRFMIGVDIDQDDLAPGKILTSVLKRIDVIVSDQIAKVKHDEFKGGQFTVGLAENAVGLTPMVHTRKEVPEGMFGLIENVSKSILAGDIKPPRTMSEVDAFLETAMQ